MARRRSQTPSEPIDADLTETVEAASESAVTQLDAHLDPVLLRAQRALETQLSFFSGTQITPVAAGVGALDLPNVIGIGIGEKFTRGQPTGLKAIKVFVARKAEASSVPPAALIPRSVGPDQVPTDVVEVEIPVADATKAGGEHTGALQRPVPCGI